MAIEIPSEVAFFLNLIGIPYPDVNEDDVRALGRHVLDFAESVRSTHESATGVITDMGSVYSGDSYEALVASWGRMSASHMADLDAACKVVAGALDIAADVITAVKVVVLAELAALAASYAFVLATPGAAAFSIAIRDVARRLCNGLEEMLIAYLAAEVIDKAIEPLEDTIDRLLKRTVRDVLDVPAPPSSSAVQPLYIEPDEVSRFADILDKHADDILRHATDFAGKVATLDFTVAGGPPDNADDLTLSPQRDTVTAPAGPYQPGAGPDMHSFPRSADSPRATNDPPPVAVSGSGADRDRPVAAGSADRPPSISGEMGSAATSAGGAHERGQAIAQDVPAAAQPSVTTAGEVGANRTDTIDNSARNGNGRMPEAAEASVADSGPRIQPAEADREHAATPTPAPSDSRQHSGHPAPPDMQGGPHPSSPFRAGNNVAASSTPWMRAPAQAPMQPAAPSGTPARKAAPTTVAGPATRGKAGETPWSKKASKTGAGKRDAMKKVVAPTLGPPPVRRPDKATAKNEEKGVDTVGETGIALSDSVLPAGKNIVTPPTRNP